MQPLRAHVRDGRITLDEPTDLPEGAEIDLVAIEDDELSPEEQAELHASLDLALEDRQAGRMVGAWACLKQYRAHRVSPRSPKPRQSSIGVVAPPQPTNNPP